MAGASLAAADGQWVSARKAIAYFRFRARLKGLVVYTAYFLTYYVHYQLLLDWIFAGNTIALYRKARSLQDGVDAGVDPWCSRSTGKSAHTGLDCWWHFKDSETIEHLHEYLAERISTFASGVQTICPNCRVGITTSGISLESLSLEDFACADFSSAQDSNAYPERDCVLSDSSWQATPTARTAPCCRNKTLVQASLTMMARKADDGQESAPLASLLGDRDIWYKFIALKMKEGSTFVQVVISRGQRMVGILYEAHARSQEWMPDQVNAIKTYWSRRYDIPKTLITLEVVYWLFGAWSLLHTLAECWSICTDRPSFFIWAQRPNTALVFLTCLPPLVVRVADPFLGVNDWTLLVAACEIIMLARLFFEAEVIPSCRILLRAMAVATSQLTTLMFVLGVLILILAGISGQLFGTFRFSGYYETIFDVLSQFATGAVLDDQSESYNSLGSKMMYFVILFVLFLTLSQVFITILMDSFEAAKEDRNDSKLELELPEGYVAAPRPNAGVIHPHAIAAAAFGWLFYYIPEYGATSPQVLRGLNIAVREAEAEDPSVVGRPLLLGEEQLAKALARAHAGPLAASRLLANFGVQLDGAPAPTSPKSAAGAALDGEAAQRDEQAELRAAVLERSVAHGVPVPYDELQRLSPDMLRRLKNTLTAGLRPPAASKDETVACL